MLLGDLLLRDVRHFLQREDTSLDDVLPANRLEGSFKCVTVGAVLVLLDPQVQHDERLKQTMTGEKNAKFNFNKAV